MAWMQPLTEEQQDDLRLPSQSWDQYLLLWPQMEVARGQISTDEFDQSFASIPWGVSDGDVADVKEGYLVYVGETADPSQAQFVFNARKGEAGNVATASYINIQQTSAALESGMWIVVLKDISETSLQPRVDTSTEPSSYYKNYAIPFRRLRPLVQNLQSVYIVELPTGGTVELELPAEALITDAEASTISTWAWDSDGVAYAGGTDSSDAQPILEFDTVGAYLVRVEITDDLGTTNWFAVRVFVVPESRDSLINLGFDGATINGSIDGGYDASIVADRVNNGQSIYQLDNILDSTLCVIWWPSPTSISPTSDIVFIGRFLLETQDNVRDPVVDTLLSCSFEIEGLMGVLSNLRCWRLAFKLSNDPSRFDFIEELTPWRAISYYLTEHSNVPNLHCLSFDDTSNRFLFPNFGTNDANGLDSVKAIGEQINACLEYAPTGEVRIHRISWYLDPSERNALPSIAIFTLDDFAVAGSGPIFNVDRSYRPTAGRQVGSGAYYNSSSEEVTVVQSVTPAVVPADGNEELSLNRQILTADSSIEEAFSEMGDRSANDLAAAQPRTKMVSSHPPAYFWMQPSRSDWFRFELPASSNTRGRAYTSGERWTLESISLSMNLELGGPIVQATWLLECRGSGYQIASSTPVGTNSFPTPVVPTVPGYPNLPPTPGNNTPDPENPQYDDEPPFDEDDILPVEDPQDPNISVPDTQQNSGTLGVLWSELHAWLVKGVGATVSYQDITPLNLDGYLISHVLKDPFSQVGWLVATHPEEDLTRFYRTLSIGQLQWTYAQFSGKYRSIGAGSTSGEMYIYGDSPTPTTEEFDFLTGEHGWTLADSPDFVNDLIGRYVAASGFREQDNKGGVPYPRGRRLYMIYEPNPLDPPITGVQVHFDIDIGNWTNSSQWAFAMNNGATESVNYVTPIYTKTSIPEGTNKTKFVSYPGIPKDLIRLDMRCSAVNSGSVSGSIRVFKIVLTYGTGARASSKRSIDRGSSFEEAKLIGSGVANGGFSPQRVGDCVYVGYDNGIQKSDGGGDYAVIAGVGADSSSSFLPGVASIGENTDDVIFTVNPLDPGDEGMYRYRSSTQTDITPLDGSTPGEGGMVVVSPDNKQVIMAIPEFDGIRKFAKSTNQGDSWTISSLVLDSTGEFVSARNSLQHAIVEAGQWFVTVNGGTSWITYTTPAAGGEDLHGFEYFR